jgi:diadenosine tetraphosphate (Ap4A) HIT family hydrolase
MPQRRRRRSLEAGCRSGRGALSSYRGRVDVVGCLACDLTAGRQPLPGGVILDAEGWRVEHCVGPLGIGTLLLKPVRHVTRVADLTAAEAAAQGLLIHRCATIIDALLSPAQTYVCLWSHAGGQPVHIHYVIQPVTEQQIADGVYGPKLQVAMFSAVEAPDPELVDQFAIQARAQLGSSALR